MSRMARVGIVVGLAVVVGLVIALKDNGGASSGEGPQRIKGQPKDREVGVRASKGIPRLVDLGADKCVPCKLMAPILKELKKEYAGRFDVEFIDVWKNPDAGKRYGMKIIPTQIFYDAWGNEIFRHEGFFSEEDILTKWKEFGLKFGPEAPTFSRLTPASPDTRPPAKVCYMCDEDVSPDTQVTVTSDAGDVRLCSPHCYFITLTSLKETQGLEEKLTVTDWTTKQEVRASKAVYLYTIDEESGRPITKAFATRDAALRERKESGGDLLTWEQLKAKELAARCGFCDRAVHPEDASEVRVAGVYTWGCCPMCALGVAARTQKDIEARVRDALTGEWVVVKTSDGSLSSLEPSTAVAWAGMRKAEGGKLVSAGCFKQAFFITESNLRKWVEQHPTATGKQITIAAALATKMKMTPQQIANACKVGECRPR